MSGQGRAPVGEPVLDEPHRAGEASALQVLSVAGDDVDDPEEGVGPVERGARAPDDLDPVDDLDRDQLLAQPVLGAGAEGHRLAVDHHLDDAGPRPETAAHPPDAQVVLHVVVDEVEAGHVLEGLADRPVAPPRDLLRGHDREDGGCALLGPDGPGGGHELDREELLVAQVEDVRVTGQTERFLGGHGVGPGSLVDPHDPHRDRGQHGERARVPGGWRP